MYIYTHTHIRLYTHVFTRIRDVLYDTGVRAQSRRTDGASNDERVVDEGWAAAGEGNRAECGNDAGRGGTDEGGGREREERSRRAVSWRLRTVS